MVVFFSFFSYLSSDVVMIAFSSFFLSVRHSIHENEPIMAGNLSDDGRYLLLSTVCQTGIHSCEIHLWDLQPNLNSATHKPSHIVSPSTQASSNSTPSLLHTYKGCVQTRYILKPSFGGLNDSLIFCGSEDSNIYIWHRQTEQLIVTLKGHQALVNQVAHTCRRWKSDRKVTSEQDRQGETEKINTLHLYASASDDETVRIWSSSDEIQQLASNVSSDVLFPLTSAQLLQEQRRSSTQDQTLESESSNEDDEDEEDLYSSSRNQEDEDDEDDEDDPNAAISRYAGMAEDREDDDYDEGDHSEEEEEEEEEEEFEEEQENDDDDDDDDDDDESSGAI